MSAAENVATSLLRQQFKSAHDWLEGTMQNVSGEQAHWKPEGNVNPIGAQYAHTLITEDVFVNNLLKGEEPLIASAFAGKAGISEPPPQGGPWTEWAARVQVDLDALRDYGQAVYASTDAYLASLPDEAVGEELDLTAVGFGKQTTAWVLNILLLNAFSHTGEISALKGMQGLQGYPM